MRYNLYVDEKVGLRERKKLRTRKLIFRTAVRLFDEQGYEETTVAEIAEASDVATKTFFNYFRSKEDLLFSDQQLRVSVMLETVESRRPEDTLVRQLERLRDELIELMMSGALDWDAELIPIRTRLIMSVPSLQARALKESFDVQRDIAEALHKAYGESLDPVSAAAVVGALVGAAQRAMITSIELDQSVQERRAALERGFDVAIRGIDAISGEAASS